MKIFLLGFMGSGKSSLGRRLAHAIDHPFLDLDKVVEEKEKKPIHEVFAQEGETHFRSLENKYLKEIIESNDDLVIATGGGTPCFNENLEIIQSSGISIYLHVPNEMLAGRLAKSKTKRPLIEGLKGEELLQFIEKTVDARTPYYESANFTIKLNNNREENLSRVLLLLSRNF